MVIIFVEGQVVDGTAVGRNIPVLIGGVDGSGNAQTLKVGTDGSLDVTVDTGPVTAADGALVTIGANADAAVQNATGTVNAHLRGIIVDLLALIAQIPASLGSKAAAASLSVVAAGWSFANMATNTTTTHKSGAGTFHGISINTAGTGSTATVYDNTAGSGTKIATISTAALLGGPLVFDAAFATGLTVVTAGAGAADITVLYA